MVRSRHIVSDVCSCVAVAAIICVIGNISGFMRGLHLTMPCGMAGIALGIVCADGVYYLGILALMASIAGNGRPCSSFVFGVVISNGPGIMAFLAGHGFNGYKVCRMSGIRTGMYFGMTRFTFKVVGGDGILHICSAALVAGVAVHGYTGGGSFADMFRRYYTVMTAIAVHIGVTVSFGGETDTVVELSHVFDRVQGMTGLAVVGLLGADSADHLQVAAIVAAITGHGLVGQAVDFAYMLIFNSFSMAQGAIVCPGSI